MKKKECAAGYSDRTEMACGEQNAVVKEESVDDYIGPQIKKLLDKYHMSKYHLQQLSGVLVINISRYVRGARTPSLQTLAKICNGFGITLSEFFEDAPYRKDPALSDEQNRLLEMWEMLDKEEKSQFISYGEFLLYSRNKEA